MNFDAVLHLTMPATGSEQIAEILAVLNPPAAVPLLSGPHLLGDDLLGPQDAECLRPGAADAVAAALASLGAGKALVVLDARRQDRLMEHAHLHAVRGGSVVPFAEQFPRAYEPVLDWQDLADRVAAVPGVAEVLVRPVESFRARPELLAADLLALAGMAEPAATAPVPTPPTFSARGVRVARALNAHIRPEERVLVREFVAENFPGPPAGNQFLRPQTRARILAAYAAVNRALFRTRLPEFVEDSYSDDARTAALASGREHEL
jgi:hypothetical protein